MPDFETFMASRARNDLILFVLTVIVLFCCSLVIRVWCVRQFRSTARDAAWAAVPVASLVAFGAPVAFIAALGSLAGLIRFRMSLSTRQALGAILVVGLGLRLLIIGQSLWYDEAFTATIAGLPLDQFIGAVAADVHPPLYYLLKWAWLHPTILLSLKPSPALFRFPDLLLGLLSIYLLYRLTLRLTGQTAIALTAAFLCALTPAAIYYSTEARSYMLLTTLIFGGTLALLEDRRILSALLIGLLPLTHHLGWVYAGVFLLISGRKSWRYLVPVLALVMPSGLLALAQSRMTMGWLVFNPTHIAYTLIFNLHAVDGRLVVPVVLPFIALTILSFWAARPLLKNPDARKVFALFLAIPIISLISILVRPLYRDPAFLPVTLLALIPLAYALHSLHWDYFRPLLFGVGAVALVSFFVNLDMTRPDYRALLRSCGTSQTVYATSIQTAFLAQANSSRDVLLWDRAGDYGMTLIIDQMPAFGFQPVSAPPTSACILFEETPRTTSQERLYLWMVTHIKTVTYHETIDTQALKRIHLYVVW